MVSDTYVNEIKSAILNKEEWFINYLKDFRTHIKQAYIKNKANFLVKIILISFIIFSFYYLWRIYEVISEPIFFIFYASTLGFLFYDRVRNKRMAERLVKRIEHIVYTILYREEDMKVHIENKELIERFYDFIVKWGEEDKIRAINDVYLIMTGQMV